MTATPTTPGVDRVELHLEAIRDAATSVDQAVAQLYDTVQQARAAGASWATIGRTLGVTKQAAQERFSGRRARAPRPPKPLPRSL